MAGTSRKPTSGPREDEVAAITACRKGDRNAYELLVKRYAPRAVGVARAILRDAALAEDLAQQAFVRAYRALKRFDLEQPFYPWFYRILKNACLTALKRRKRHDALSLDVEGAPTPAVAPADPSTRAERRELRATIEGAMDRLTEPHREILHLAHFEALSYKEIAACLEIPIGTVMSRLFSARKALRKVLGPLLDEEDAGDE